MTGENSFREIDIVKKRSEKILVYIKVHEFFRFAFFAIDTL